MFRNVILQALGAQSEVTPVTGRIRLRRGDILLLCSDGLSGKLRAEDIQNIVMSNPELPQACSELIAEANNRGGEDNITVVLARFEGNDLEEPANERITIELPQLEEDKTLDDNYEADTEPH
jgi:protein phosphatase